MIEFTVLGNHLHLVVEADSDASLSRGMQGLGVRIAKALNRLMGRIGSVFADHYHSELLPTPPSSSTHSGTCSATAHTTSAARQATIRSPPGDTAPRNG